MQQDPNLVPPYIDMEEHTKDIVAHRALNPRIARLAGILQSLEDTNRLLGSDLYSNSLAYYRNLREAAKVNSVGASTKYSDLKQQFPGPGSNAKNRKAPDSDEN
jgi:predicted anti-sigma-YlaC factor YlaD